MSRNYQQDRDWREREGRYRGGDNYPIRDDQDDMYEGRERSRRDEQSWRGEQNMGSARNRDEMPRAWEQDRGYNRGESRGQQRFGNVQSFGERENYGYNRPENQDWDQYGDASRGRSSRATSGYQGMNERGWNEGTYDWNQARQGQFNQGQFTGRGPRNYKRGDERIEEDINERLTQHGTLDATDIEVTVQNGEVTLKGNVESRQAKRLAEEVAEAVSGVKDVTNHLKIQQSKTESQRGESTTTETSGKTQQRKAG